MRRMEGAVLRTLGAILLLSVAASGQDSGDKLAKRLEKIDQKFLQKLVELAKKYDEARDAEAAHWLASCAVALGSKDLEALKIKSAWELDLFVGKVRGGEVLKDASPINIALRASAYEYKKMVDRLVLEARRKGLGEKRKRILHDSAIRQELARGAADYIQATQRVNALRRAMGLRAVLWDAEASTKLILAAWYTGETGDWEYREPKKESVFYSSAVDVAKEKTARVFRTIRVVPDILRSVALIRQQLLNPNARRLWLAHWGGGKLIEGVTIYAIPQLPYREDIPTASQRYQGSTVTKDWVDTEDTIEIGGRKVPFVRYPYPNEADAPWAFAHGREGMEARWAKSEHEYLEKAGVPIMLRFFTEATLSEIKTSLENSSGKSYPCRLYLNGDKRAALEAKWATLLLVPEKQLSKSSTYTIRVTCKLEGVRFDQTWKFTTRAK